MNELESRTTRPETSVRLIVRLIVDILGFIAVAAVLLALCAALAALADGLARGFGGLGADIAAIRDMRLTAPRSLRMLFGVLIGALFYVVVIVAIATVARLRRGRAWRDYVAWRPFRLDWVYALVALAGVAWGVGIGAVIERLNPASKDWVALPHEPVGIAVGFVLVVLLGPLCEELFFRGWLFSALRPKFGRVATILVTGALFAVAHWESTHLYALAVFPIGLLLGYVRERADSARASFAFHGAYNFAGWFLATFTTP